MNKYLIFLLSIFFCIPLSAKEIKVSKSGSVKSVKQALQQAKDGDVIKIEKGIYKEYDINVEKSVKIIGEDGVIIDGQKKGKIFQVYADGVEISHMTIQNVGISYTTDFAAVRLTKCKNFVLSNLNLKNLFFGIYLEKANNGIIKNNHIEGIAKDEYNSGNGIHLWYSHYIQVYNNYISGMRDGMYFEFANNCKIKSNISTKNLRYGLHFMFSNDDDYENNTFKNNGAGVAVMFSKRINMINNNFYHNWGNSSYGLLLKEIYDAEIINNKFIKNTIGIQIEGSTRINYFNNDFNQNGWAIKMTGAAYQNKFHRNNFINNSFDLSFNSNLNDNEFKENYWSEYTGYDLNHDGFGDVPYRPVKLFSYVVNKTPETIVLLRSLFVDIINFSEKVSPVFTPDGLIDSSPKMQAYP